jgi:hypothetical protein
VVVFGEASVRFAQVVTLPEKQLLPAGVTFPGSDKRRLALNIMYWLAGVLDKELCQARFTTSQFDNRDVVS